MPAGFSLPQHAVGLVAARYGKENLVEGLETHALNAELNASISTVQLSHGRHNLWQVTPGRSEDTRLCRWALAQR